MEPELFHSGSSLGCDLVPESRVDLKSSTQALALSPVSQVTLNKSLPSQAFSASSRLCS